MKWIRSEVICAFGKWPRTPGMNAADLPELVRAILPGSPPCAATSSANALTVTAPLPRVANSTPRLSSIGLVCPARPPGFAAGAWSDAETACDLIEANAQRTGGIAGLVRVPGNLAGWLTDLCCCAASAPREAETHLTGSWDRAVPIICSWIARVIRPILGDRLARALSFWRSPICSLLSGV